MIGDVEPNADVADALMRLADGHGRLLWHHSKPWASANFTGTRDELCFEYLGAEAMAAGTALVDQMRELEFRLPGRIVADAVLGFNRRLNKPMPRFVAVIELLIVED
jgi:hypothetical protein